VPCENPCIQLEVVKTLNLATLLLVDSGPLEHECLEVMDEVFLSWPYLTVQRISHLDIGYFTVGIRFVWDGTHFARYALVTLDSVIEACPLLVGTSALKAKCVALTGQLAAGVRVNLYTDSKYAFTTIHIHRALYKGRGLVNSGRKSIKYGQKILELLDTLWAPKWVAVITFRGHQKGDTIVGGNWKVGREAKQVALIRGPSPTVLTAASFPFPLAEWDPWYTPQEQAWFKTDEGNFLPNRWWKFANDLIAIPKSLAPAFVKQFTKELIQGK
jgi:hypothetical protein